MGQYLSSRTFYGYVRTDEATSLFEDFDGEWVDKILADRGITDRTDWEDYPSYGTPNYDAMYVAWRERNQEARDEWQAARDAVTAEFPIEIVHGGVTDWWMPCVAIKSSIITAHDAITKLDALPQVPLSHDWDTKLLRWFETVGLDLSEENWRDKKVWDGPSWFTAISYG